MPVSSVLTYNVPGGMVHFLLHSPQTALTEVKTKVKLEQRLGDKERELTAVKQKLQEVSSVCE